MVPGVGVVRVEIVWVLGSSARVLQAVLLRGYLVDHDDVRIADGAATFDRKLDMGMSDRFTMECRGDFDGVTIITTAELSISDLPPARIGGGVGQCLLLLHLDDVWYSSLVSVTAAAAGGAERSW